MNICDVHKKFRCELIDVSGGIENEGEIGIKNEEKMRSLFLLTEGLFRAK
jgi:phosphoribosylanthranilate isomerase